MADVAKEREEYVGEGEAGNPAGICIPVVEGGCAGRGGAGRVAGLRSAARPAQR